MLQRIVVVGAGIAGVTVCQALRAGGFDGGLTLVGAEDHLPYDRPPLSKKALRDPTRLQDTTLHPADWYAEQGIDLRLGRKVTALRPGDGGVEVDVGAVERGDVVVVATGGTPCQLDLPGVDHPAVLTLRTRDDAERLRSVLLLGGRLVVIGGGLIGAEATASAVAMGCSVTLIEPYPPPLARAVGPLVAGLLHAEHAAHGVRVITARPVAFTAPGPAGPVRVHLSDGTDVDAETVLVGVGIDPDTRLGQEAGLAVDHGILVGADQRSSSPQVYAVGDAARHTGPDGPLPRIEHWDGAKRSAEAAARAILGAPPVVVTPWFWSDRYDTHLEMAGEADPGADVVTRGAAGSPGGLSVFFLRGQRCVGAVTLNRPLDCRAAQRLINRAVPVDTAQIADETVDLRDLLNR
ncbi:FAD-dependent oxidoreductase [Longispora sp. K20-0274]|uniref:NAD(P)/FAD-dependent oxidoreductase n=1 Tax=Longispora sp. K20-0274 TaxID=3088255 RepID=UPI00399AB5AD